MVLVTSVFDLPFLFLIWVIDTYLFLATARLVIGLSPKARQSHIYSQLKLLTDPVPKLINMRFSRRTAIADHLDLLWLIVIGTGCILRQILISIVLT
jgi:hypothetical protein